MYVSSWLFVQLVYSSYASFKLNVILEICPSNFDDQLPLSTSASASACRMRPFAELSGFLLSCCLNIPTVHDPTTQKKRDGTTQLEFSPCSFSFHHPILKKCCLFLLATSALYMPTASVVKLQTTFDPTHLVPLGQSDLKSDSCWLPHPRPWRDRSQSREIRRRKTSWGSPDSLHPFIPGFFLKTFGSEDFKTLRLSWFDVNQKDELGKGLQWVKLGKWQRSEIPSTLWLESLFASQNHVWCLSYFVVTTCSHSTREVEYDE